MIELVKKYAMSFVGTPYLWGGDDPMSGFDCSGFIQEILEAFGRDPRGDQTANDLYLYFIEKGDCVGYPKAGHLVFYGSSARITHVSMCLDDHYVIEAGGGRRSTNSLSAAIRQNAYVRIRPIGYRKDLVAIIDPIW